MEVIKLRDEFIKLGQALKAAGLVESGVDAKFVSSIDLIIIFLPNYSSIIIVSPSNFTTSPAINFLPR